MPQEKDLSGQGWIIDPRVNEGSASSLFAEINVFFGYFFRFGISC